jgi:hypothetical protein
VRLRPDSHRVRRHRVYTMLYLSLCIHDGDFEKRWCVLDVRDSRRTGCLDSKIEAHPLTENQLALSCLCVSFFSLGKPGVENCIMELPAVPEKFQRKRGGRRKDETPTHIASCGLKLR